MMLLIYLSISRNKCLTTHFFPLLNNSFHLGGGHSIRSICPLIPPPDAALPYNLMSFCEVFKLRFHREKKETPEVADSLDDIFGKKSANSGNMFSKEIADDDLFSVTNISATDQTGGLNQDDITKYINDNLNDEVADLGL